MKSINDMESEDENMELKNDAPFLAAISKENSFTTPEGYFKNLKEEILSQARLQQLVQAENAFEVPDLYFEDLSQNIQSITHLDSLMQTATNQGFEVPKGYFAQSSAIIKRQTAPKTKIVKLFKTHFIRYAAAACVLLTTSAGIYFNVMQNTSVSYQLSKIPATEIESYLSQHIDANDLPLLIENTDNDFNLDINDFTVE